ncbi:hypothetical protein EV182_000025 [Spiromyces aspiralis]|uniref:Uncharacterized protein n=1 Tax=Spiromyces aspiralis TaxID=68401 RepID=A0ACC1HL78_9FUNG|nr:hypothetical protein EV182_000025 [Spiromyces aspiralis]
MLHIPTSHCKPSHPGAHHTLPPLVAATSPSPFAPSSYLRTHHPYLSQTPSPHYHRLRQRPASPPHPHRRPRTTSHHGTRPQPNHQHSNKGSASPPSPRPKRSPRPVNTFLRYRKEKMLELRALKGRLSQTKISRLSSAMWKSEPEEVKLHYKRRYQAEKDHYELHARLQDLVASPNPASSSCSVTSSLSMPLSGTDKPLPAIVANLDAPSHSHSDLAENGAGRGRVPGPNASPHHVHSSSLASLHEPLLAKAGTAHSETSLINLPLRPDPNQPISLPTPTPDTTNTVPTSYRTSISFLLC